MLSLSKTDKRRSLASVAVIALLFLFPVTVSAISLTEYQQKIKQAINALDTLSQVEKNESETDFNNRLLQTIESVQATLPEHLTVEVNGEVYQVDNSSIHKTLEDVKSLAVEEQFKKIIQVKQILHALEVRFAERVGATASDETKEQAKSRLESILARPEYTTEPRGNALSRAIENSYNRLRSLFPRQRSMSPGRLDWLTFIVEMVVISLAVAVLLYVALVLLRRFGRIRRPRVRKKKQARIVLGERLEPEATSTDLLSQAEALVRHGDIRGAIRKAYIALLVELGDRKLISLAQYKTNRDYLNSVRSVPPLHSTMRGLTAIFERHWYGVEQATPDDWQDFRAGYLAALQAEN